jgi:chromosome segregation ATPase
MKPRPRLFTADPEVLGGDGPSAVANPATPEASFLEKCAASIQSKGNLLAAAEASNLRATAAEASLATATEQIAGLTAEVASLKADQAAIEAMLTAAKAEQKTVEAAVATTVASMGFPLEALPAANAEAGETRADIEAQLAAATDNDTRYALAEKLNSLD